jgi:hypothetical protein
MTQEWQGGWLPVIPSEAPFVVIGQDVTIYPLTRIVDPGRVWLGSRA